MRMTPPKPNQRGIPGVGENNSTCINWLTHRPAAATGAMPLGPIVVGVQVAEQT
jgi:hypothetical protein